jgi:hypothetical protein
MAKHRIVEKVITKHLGASGPFDLFQVLRLVNNVALNNPPKTVHDYLVGVLLMELFTQAELTDFLHSSMSDFP